MQPVILVVDDDRAMGELLSDVLGAHAFEVLVSQTGNDALATVSFFSASFEAGTGP